MINKCPDWISDVPQSKQTEFLADLAAVYHYVFNRSYSFLLDSGIISDWHAKMFRRVVPLDYYAGGIRCDLPSKPCLGIDVAVGGIPGSSYKAAKYELAVLLQKSMNEMSRLELRWSELTAQYKSICIAKLISELVGQFIRVHPFINGNGRMSRLIWAWGMHRFALPLQARLTPRPDGPYSQMMANCMMGNDKQLALYILTEMGTATPSQIITSKK